MPHHLIAPNALAVSLALNYTIEDINLPGFKLHPLKGDRQGLWSISVSGNWRITFEFVDGNAHILNYEDYH